MALREDSPAVLVARFLRNNNYHETLAAFTAEANLPHDVDIVHARNLDDILTLEQVLQEKKTFDLSRSFETVTLQDDHLSTGWKIPAPFKPSLIDAGSPASNILHVSVIPQVEEDPICIVTTAAKSIHKRSIEANGVFYRDEQIQPSALDSPVLDCTWISARYIVYACMSGLVSLCDLSTAQTIDERRDHRKFTVCVVSSCKSDTGMQEETRGMWVATASWDSKVFLYKIEPGKPKLGAPVASLDLPTIPECIRFVDHPEIDAPVLLLGRRNSSYLYYYALVSLSSSNSSSSASGSSNSSSTTASVAARAEHVSTQQLQLLGEQNLAPHSLTWTAFSPCWFELHPHDRHICAIATNTTPSLKLLVVRLLVPPPLASSSSSAAVTTELSPPSIPTLTAHVPRRPSLSPWEKQRLDNRDESAILLSTTTHAPQTEHSTPRLVFRPDGRGVWVNGDDGVVRGIEVSTGKVIARLGGLSSLDSGHSETTTTSNTTGAEGACMHEPGSKIRCLWAGFITTTTSTSNIDTDIDDTDSAVTVTSTNPTDSTRTRTQTQTASASREGKKEEILISGGFDRRCIIWRT